MSTGEEGNLEREPRKARLVDREDLSATLAIFRIEPEGGVPEFEAGQFLTLGLRQASGRVLWRPYSIASSPEERNHFEFYMRWARVPVAGRFTTALWDVKYGDPVLWKPPKGHFTIAHRMPDGSPDQRRILLVGGGTGLAPLISYVLHLRHCASRRAIVLCHGARHVRELGYRRLLLDLERSGQAGGETWSFRYLPTVSRPWDKENTRWTGHTGRVDTLLARPESGAPSPVEAAIGRPISPRDTSVYVSGFEGTVTSVLSVLEPLGFRTERSARPDGSYDVRCESYG